jgi:hypothetical protein
MSRAFVWFPALLSLAACQGRSGALATGEIGSLDASPESWTGGPPVDARDPASPEATPDSSSREANTTPTCALSGQQCFGTPCCDGAGMCQEVPYMGTSTWTCGGSIAGGSNQICASPPGPACHWTELSGCGGYGRIDAFCPAGQSTRQLRRCDGSCFAPDRLYQQYQLCACESAAGPGRPACCLGTAWHAVLCCDGAP